VTPALFLVAAGLGTVIRWRCGSRPLGILAVNVVGAFLLGLLTGSSPDTVLVGGLAGIGALTTFSTFVAQLVELAEHDRRHAVAYGAATFVFGVGAAWLGLQLA